MLLLSLVGLGLPLTGVAEEEVERKYRVFEQRQKRGPEGGLPITVL